MVRVGKGEGCACMTFFNFPFFLFFFFFPQVRVPSVTNLFKSITKSDAGAGTPKPGAGFGYRCFGQLLSGAMPRDDDFFLLIDA
jgi:hypothetical protein